MLSIHESTRFKKDFKKVMREPYFDGELFEYVVTALAEQRPLEERFRDHELTGDYKGYRECHIKPDWLLIYRVYESDLVLYLTRTGSHSNLF